MTLLALGMILIQLNSFSCLKSLVQLILAVLSEQDDLRSLTPLFLVLDLVFSTILSLNSSLRFMF